MTDFSDMPVPALGPAFTLLLEAEHCARIGPLPTGGVREHVSFREGRVHGDRLHGRLLPAHASETRLRRADGVTVVELHAVLRTDDGHEVRLTGTGYATEAPHFDGTRLSLLFETDEHGPYEWLSRTAFLAEREAGTETYSVVEIL